MTFTDAQTGYLASQRLGRLATIGPDGSPQVKPVGFRYNPLITDCGRLPAAVRAYSRLIALRHVIGLAVGSAPELVFCAPGQHAVRHRDRGSAAFVLSPAGFPPAVGGRCLIRLGGVAGGDLRPVPPAP